MKKLAASILMCCALLACSEQRPKDIKDLFKESFKKRTTVQAFRADLSYQTGFSEATLKNEKESLIAEFAENGKDFKFYSVNGDNQVAFNGKRLTVVNNKDKWFFSTENPQEFAQDLQRKARVIENFLPFLKYEEYAQGIDSSSQFKDFVWEADTVVNSEDSYHISNKSFDERLGLDFYSNQLISKNTGFPTAILSVVKNGDHLIQVDNMLINKVEVVNDIDDKEFDLQVPAGYMTYEEYVTSQNQKEMEKAADTITPVEMKEGDLVPDWTLKDADGKEISLSSLRGKPVILDFWGTWCIWCVVAMPKIEAVYQEFGDKIHIYGISCREPEGANPKEFLKEKKVSYPTLVDGDKVAQLLNVQGYPTLYVIGKDGKLLYQHSGYDKELDKNLTKILKENL